MLPIDTSIDHASNIAMPSVSEIEKTVCLALQEDMGSGDLTAELLPADMQSTAGLIIRENAILCGTMWFDNVFQQIDKTIMIDWQVGDGSHVQKDQQLCSLRGPIQALLTGERTAINFLQTLSATATITGQYVQLLAATTTKLLDTRKTIPGLRRAQKYAVLCGGGNNHRLGLFDGILLKENHINAFGSISAAVKTAQQKHSGLPIEVEVETLQQLKEAIDANADMIMLDNFSLPDIQSAVMIADGRVKLEASGSYDLTTLPLVADTGIDYVSVGALTKNIRAIDLSIRFSD